MFFGLLTILSCNNDKECINPPDCFTGPLPMPIGILDRDGENMLDPEYPDRLEIDAVTSKVMGKIPFEITSIKGGTIETGFWYLEIKKTPNTIRPDCDDNVLDCNLCINEECELYISYSNSTDIDTLNVLYERVTEFTEDNCPCTYYPMRFIKHNGVSIIDDIYEKTPYAFIIRK